MKKTLLMIGVITVLMLASIAAVYGANVNVNGSDVAFTESTGYPYVDGNNRTQVPLRVTMEQAGATVTWDSGSKIATIEKRGIVVQVPIGVNYIIVDGKQVSTDTAAVIKNGRIYLPIRAVLEAVDFSVEWDKDSQTVFAANYYDYIANQEMVVAEKRQNISTAEDLLNYLVSEFRLVHEKEQAVKLAERDYLDKFNKDTVKAVSYFEWYTKDQLKNNGITLDDSLFTLKRDSDFTKCTFGGKLVLEGEGKTVTINVPEFSIPLSYNDDDEDGDTGGDYKKDASRTYDGVTIYFSPWGIEFEGKDLADLGLIN